MEQTPDLCPELFYPVRGRRASRQITPTGMPCTLPMGDELRGSAVELSNFTLMFTGLATAAVCASRWKCSRARPARPFAEAFVRRSAYAAYVNTRFSDASYLAQVRRLRKLAVVAVARYPLQVSAVKFVQHGENTTFRVDARHGRRYLLRVHRSGYHSKAAIQEELAWLDLLSHAGLSVPKPVAAKSGEWVETVASCDVPATMNCSLLQWVEGRFIRKSVTPKHLFRVGRVLADLQTHARDSTVVHRRYWSSEGLVGASARFGSIDSLAGVRPELQAAISRARKRVLKTLRQFERQFPERQGLIHADLHFGNILSAGDELVAIDFDDCGHGFHAYDLAVPLLSVEGMLGREKRKRLPEFQDALISGYSSKKAWDHHDERIFPYLIAARRLAMLGWLSSRRDNPRLRKLLSRAASNAVQCVML